ncbi:MULTISPECIES: hypothetical protein [Aeromonas]|uniref:hypothetical protein n=1 Tax=Aeromonas TaxID=642 RepID=UPI001495C3B0|nr:MULTISPECIES: hypothetical protein [Aeromonas]MBA8782446.1 hypothetical protein [Aeromonas caviae]MBA8786501.1 hypothetical protein [Aeromonas sp. TW 6]MDX7823643.1 hypothetical protein [Aeromonas caviae]MEA9417814.1 hypothetical protein [Aeromonas caviae]
MRALLLIALFVALPAKAADETECRQAFLEWMLSQQKQFSDRKASKMERRNAERAIDQARDAFAKQESFCQTMAWVASTEDNDPRFKPRTGEIHDFTPRG